MTTWQGLHVAWSENANLPKRNEMATELTHNNPIDKVWELYTNVKHLEIVTPKEMRLKVINTTGETLTQGSEIWLEAKILERGVPM